MLTGPKIVAGGEPLSVCQIQLTLMQVQRKRELHCTYAHPVCTGLWTRGFQPQTSWAGAAAGGAGAGHQLQRLHSIAQPQLGAAMPAQALFDPEEDGGAEQEDVLLFFGIIDFLQVQARICNVFPGPLCPLMPELGWDFYDC